MTIGHVTHEVWFYFEFYIADPISKTRQWFVMRALRRTVASRTRLDNGTEAFPLRTYQELEYYAPSTSIAFLDPTVAMPSPGTHR